LALRIFFFSFPRAIFPQIFFPVSQTPLFRRFPSPPPEQGGNMRSPKDEVPSHFNVVTQPPPARLPRNFSPPVPPSFACQNRTTMSTRPFWPHFVLIVLVWPTFASRFCPKLCRPIFFPWGPASLDRPPPPLSMNIFSVPFGLQVSFAEMVDIRLVLVTPYFHMRPIFPPYKYPVDGLAFCEKCALILGEQVFWLGNSPHPHPPRFRPSFGPVPPGPNSLLSWPHLSFPWPFPFPGRCSLPPHKFCPPPKAHLRPTTVLFFPPLSPQKEDRWSPNVLTQTYHRVHSLGSKNVNCMMGHPRTPPIVFSNNDVWTHSGKKSSHVRVM